MTAADDRRITWRGDSGTGLHYATHANGMPAAIVRRCQPSAYEWTAWDEQGRRVGCGGGHGKPGPAMAAAEFALDGTRAGEGEGAALHEHDVDALAERLRAAYRDDDPSAPLPAGTREDWRRVAREAVATLRGSEPAEPPGDTYMDYLARSGYFGAVSEVAADESDPKHDALVLAIRAFTVETGDQPNGPAERAWVVLQRALKRPVVSRVDANNAAAMLAEATADDVRALRVAAEAYFGGDFRKP